MDKKSAAGFSLSAGSSKGKTSSKSGSDAAAKAAAAAAAAQNNQAMFNQSLFASTPGIGLLVLRSNFLKVRKWIGVLGHIECGSSANLFLKDEKV
ncbi:unnamed protein product [Notodromas monacha]|uniref:Uncharacterized protein n=1 Tax=Notodromas monacha TaxID=399045 RepID=A0A7R9BUY6_9CRUS|nr:unnamed protein product [Notodromas monacha]CAG0922207.1 unnamed protein product [Notodromas monacha]